MIDIGSLAISAVLFAAFVPGVLVTLPGKGSDRMVVLAVHGLLFALVAMYAMKWYWGMKENMGNYGVKCPNGYKMLPDQTCVPVGGPTYNPATA
jgi:hypothetical protein